MGAVLTLCWFSLCNSERLNAVTLAFCTVQKLFFRIIHAKFGILNSPQSPHLWKDSVEVISDFQISGQSLVNENCQNSRTSNNIHMKLGPVTRLDKRNMAMSKKLTMTSC